LKNKWIEPSEIVKLQCLGVTFGDALAQKLGLKWVAVEDEYGRDPALIVEGTSIITFPLTSISKRIENGEEVDVFNLFENACSKINELKQQLV
jgi:NAD-dependent SIR2 family protein deacetylase